MKTSQLFYLAEKIQCCIAQFSYQIVCQSWDTSPTLNGMPNISRLSLSFAASWLTQQQQWFLTTVLKSNVVYLANALLFILMYSRRVIGRGGSSWNYSKQNHNKGLFDKKFSNPHYQSKSNIWITSTVLCCILGLFRAHPTLVIRPVVVKWEGSWRFPALSAICRPVCAGLSVPGFPSGSVRYSGAILSVFGWAAAVDSHPAGKLSKKKCA